MISVRRSGRFVALATTVAALLCFGLVSSPAGASFKEVPPADGYWLLTGNGGVTNLGTPFKGAPASDPSRCAVSPLPGRAPQPNGTCWTMTATSGGGGYWIMNSLTGDVFNYGSAKLFGTPKLKFAGTSPEFLPVFRQIVATPDNAGYWVYEIGASDLGKVDHYGNAGFFGDTTTIVGKSGHGLNGSPVGIAATANGKGYWEVYSDGGVFAFGNARFAGSMAGKHLASPIVAIVSTATGKGYYLAAADGGVFAFGDARFAGSRANRPHGPIVSMARNPVGKGYWLASSNGQVFSFGGAPFFGTLTSFGVRGRVYAIVTRSGS